MLSLREFLARTALWSASFCVVTTSLSAQDVLRIDGHRTGPSVLERRLASRVSLTPGELTLEGLAEWLRQMFSINVQLDRRALEDIGLGPQDTLPAFELSDVVLEEALSLVLNERKLTLRVDHDTLIITTREEAENLLETRVYPVADLVCVGRSADRPDDPALDDYDTLIHTITSTIAPDSWEDVGGPGAIEAYWASRAVVISQTRDVHRQIAPVLDTLRHAQSVSQSFVGDRVASRSAVGSRPYTPRSTTPARTGPTRPGRYVYRPRGSWQMPTPRD